MLRRIPSLSLVFVLALSLSGCVAPDSVEDAAKGAADTAANAVDTARNLTGDAVEMVDALSNIEAGKISRLVVRDAVTNEVITEITDQNAINNALAGMSGINSIASTPEEPQEYLFEIWQPATILFGESSSETNDIMVLEIVTFKGSEVIRTTVSPLNLSLSFSAPDTAHRLRALAQ